MACIKLKGVVLDIPIFDSVERSLRTHTINAFTGGKILNTFNKKMIIRALNEVNLDIHEGDAVGLVGPNGSGKSSLLRVISGIYKPTAGSVSVIGELRPLISLGVGLEANLTGMDNIRRLGALYGYKREAVEEQIDQIVSFSGLGDFIGLPVRSYSSGMVLRLMFATLVTGNPDIVILDEFFSAGDEDFVKKSEKRMEKLLDNAKILVFASHSKSLVKRYCNRFIRMDNGKPIEIGVEEV
jgi:ABC-type polysaccharide/polyol phosphate transport system ATPase subunit